MRRFSCLVWASLVVLLGQGCDDGSTTATPPVDAVAVDRGAAPDAGPDDAGPDDAGPDAEPVDAAPPALDPAPEVAPTPIDIPLWRVASAPDPDPMPDALRAGALEGLPDEGRDARGLTWTTVNPDENGELPGFDRRVGWAVTTLETPEPVSLIAQAGSAYAVFVNGRQLPGDFYRSGKARLPFTTRAGTNVIAWRILGGRGNPRLKLWTTPDPITLNLADLTVPDWPVGADFPQWVGVATLNHGPGLRGVRARVIESARFEGTVVEHPSLPGGAVTQLAFELRPKAPFEAAELALPVTLQVEADGLPLGYARTITLATVAADAPWRRARRSRVDGSVQYAGIRPPTDPASDGQKALVLSLHGAGVEAINQAGSYSPKGWAWLVAPTNRRPFGFDWEDWGRLDGLEALDDAMGLFATDPTRTYLTGHSMGGHGTWQLGVHDSQRFAVIGPSAGWSSFYSYTGRTRPTGFFARARAHSETMDFLGNLVDRAIYIIHGTADDNVPLREGEALFEAVSGLTDDVAFHREAGAGHWWDGEASPGADCVDWPPLFDLMQDRALPALLTDFDWTCSGAWYCKPYAFVTLRSAESPMAALRVTSAREGDRVVLETENVRSLTLDGALLTEHGVTEVEVDGQAHPVVADEMPVGPQSGKRPGVHGPVNEVFYQPWCFVLADRAPQPFVDYAAYLVSYWSLIGNGSACALRSSEVTPEIRAARNLVYVGLDARDLPTRPEGLDWDDLVVSVGGRDYPRVALVATWADGDRLSAIFTATAFDEPLLYNYVPFGSNSGLPDFLVFGEDGGRAAGFYDAEWHYDPATSSP